MYFISVAVILLPSLALILLYIEYKIAGHYNHGEWWGYRNWEIHLNNKYVMFYYILSYVFYDPYEQLVIENTSVQF